ncbi:hypothetical protein [Methylophilus medardicus]|uniref:Uncharacterized protein n=1 Tax=Methylophilus medardicus TaxID=2588534 RepID=A0A5B8CPW0_9PROT|nr:hypothetical protein [Methylophilus medardicus]QDC43295.1 hypothetical protein FIU01_01325 [Methylophilus medardicus]QDC48302.1 hypothetical protein FIU00_01325 [Methylophilus medardicus]QDC52007.1 hypothetical protein FIT99_01325 [Methylophilus medardicus]
MHTKWRLNVIARLTLMTIHYIRIAQIRPDVSSVAGFLISRRAGCRAVAKASNNACMKSPWTYG